MGWQNIKKAAELGNPISMCTLGQYYFEGWEDFKVNKVKGLELIKRAADAGYDYAQSLYDEYKEQ